MVRGFIRNPDRGVVGSDDVGVSGRGRYVIPEFTDHM